MENKSGMEPDPLRVLKISVFIFDIRYKLFIFTSNSKKKSII